MGFFAIAHWTAVLTKTLDYSSKTVKIYRVVNILNHLTSRLAMHTAL